MTGKQNTLVTPSEVNMSDILLPDWWNRDKPGSLKDLILSIKTSGQQVPVLVRAQENGKFLLIDGRRRYMALKEMGAKTVRVAEAIGDAEKDYLHSLVINVQRKGHNPMERARVYKELSESNMKNRDIAKACGDVSEGHVSQHLAFFELPAKMQRSLKEEKITSGHARQLLRVNEEEDLTFQEKIYDKMANSSLSVSDSEEVTAHYVHRKEEKAQAKADKTKKSKGASVKGGKAPAKSSPGRKPQVTDYTEIELEMESVDKAREFLTYYEEVRSKTRSPKKQSFYKGVILGLELLSGITVLED